MLATTALGGGATEPAAAAGRPVAGLAKFNSCGAVASYSRRHARKLLREQKRVEARLRREQRRLVSPDVGSGREPAENAEPLAAEPEDYSTTNNQEKGIDEADIVKTDGSFIFSVADGHLRAIDVRGPAPVLAGTLDLPANGYHELLLAGTRLVVIGAGFDGAVQLYDVDVSDPARMHVDRQLTTAGEYVAGRLTGTTARVVLTSIPSAYAPVRERLGAYGGGDAVRTTASRRRGRKQRRKVSWLPTATFRDRIAGRRTKRRLVGCTSVRRPTDFAGLDVLTVLTLDLTEGIDPVDSDAVMLDADEVTGTVYESDRGLYVATERYSYPSDYDDDNPETHVHRFDTSLPGRTEYAASGAVRGTLLSQFAFSEHRGHLRVASTAGSGRRRQSFVTVLAQIGGRLARVGRVGGLGRGEELYAVRFIGDRGFVVTFEEIDPLYTLDLSVPSRPLATGELKIRGYSAYLHPIGDHKLLGVGQDATRQGAPLGTQVSLFDVSDPRRPARLAVKRLGGLSDSEVEYDHRAFLYWEPSSLAVIPYSGLERRTPFAGAVALGLARPGAIDELRRITHPFGTRTNPAQITRSVVIGERLYTLSDRGVAANRIGDYSTLGLLPFPRR